MTLVPVALIPVSRLAASRRFRRVTSIIVFITAMACPLIGHSTTIDIDDANDSFAPFADFHMVSGNDPSSSPGQVLDILTLHSNGSESGSNSVTVGSIHSVFASDGVTTATNLVVGFGVNETGPIGNNSVTISDLVITLERVGGAVETFSLLLDSVRVFNYSQGQSTAEARFEIALGFDFMTEYAGTSTEALGIQATIDNTSDGFEIFFLSSAYTSEATSAAAVPEPGTLTLMVLGFAGWALLGRSRWASGLGSSTCVSARGPSIRLA